MILNGLSVVKDCLKFLTWIYLLSIFSVMLVLLIVIKMVNLDMNLMEELPRFMYGCHCQIARTENKIEIMRNGARESKG